MPRGKGTEEADKLTRIAIVNSDKCKPKRCRQECKKSCPVVRMGKLCIEVTPNDKIAAISEELCIGCGICVKVVFVKVLFQCCNNCYLFIYTTPGCRNAPLKPSQLLICPAILKGILRIDTPRTPLNCIGCQFQDLVKF